MSIDYTIDVRVKFYLKASGRSPIEEFLNERSQELRSDFFVKRGDAIYLLHAFRKKTQELPRKETDIALSRIKEI